MIFEKDILYPGAVQPPGFTDPFAISPEMVNGLQARMSEMLAAGLHIPLAWEHQDLAKPMTKAQLAEHKAELAKLTLGHTRAAALADGKIIATVDVAVDADAERLKAVKFVSPEIMWDFTDGDGKLWPGPSITHLAVTPRPVQHQQGPFKPVALSLLRLAENDYQPAESKEGEAAAGGTGKLKELLSELAAIGLPLGDDTTLDNLIERLCVAVKTKAAAEGNGAGQEKDADMAPGVLMSLQTRILDMERANLETRIKALADTGRISKALGTKLDAELKMVQLSLDAEGKLSPTSLTAKVEAYEVLDANTAWPADKMRLALGNGEERDVLPPDDAEAENKRIRDEARERAKRVSRTPVAAK